MAKLIYVSPQGDDLDGDGTLQRPFATTERAEMVGEVGDMILVEHDGVVLPPGGRMPQRRGGWKFRLWSTVCAVSMAYAFGRLFQLSPPVALVTAGLTAGLVALLVEDPQPW